MLYTQIWCCLISGKSGEVSMYSKSTKVILILNVKQVKGYFIIIISVNNKKNMHTIITMHTCHIIKCKKI